MGAPNFGGKGGGGIFRGPDQIFRTVLFCPILCGDF